MREKELRIALVCFGGVSLAIYMHGICKEILKLYVHRVLCTESPIVRSAPKPHFSTMSIPKDPEYDTEADYFELLREIGRKVELRVIVDTIAGASAGGINATCLRAR